MQSLQNLSNLQGLGISRKANESLMQYIQSLSGLVAYYPMDETSGTVCYNRAPATLGTLDGTITGATINQAGQVGRAYSFDGVNDHVTIPDNDLLDFNANGLTIGCIIRIPTMTAGFNYDGILGKYDVDLNQRGYALSFKEASAAGIQKLRFLYSRAADSQAAGDAILESKGYVQAGVRTFIIVAVFNPSTYARIYVNKILITEDTTDVQSSIASNNSPFEIGRWQASSDFHLNAIIQHVFKIDGVLSEAQIVRLAEIAGIDNPEVIYAIGDSLTSAGYYTDKVQLLLSTNDKDKIIYSKGSTGNKTSQMLARFENDILSNTYRDYVIVWGGINDVKIDIDATTIESNLQSMYTMAHDAGLKVVSINISPWHDAQWSAPRQAVLETVNAWIANTAINIDYKIDAYTLLEDPDNLTNLLAAYDSGDHIHLSIAGYEAVGQAVYDAVFA